MLAIALHRSAGSTGLSHTFTADRSETSRTSVYQETMPPKRKRKDSPPPRGLAAGEQLKRSKLAGNDSWAWGWVDIEVSDPSQITLEHRLMTCGLSRRNRNPFCGSKYVSQSEQPKSTAATQEPTAKIANGELENDIIIVSDDEMPSCSKKTCKNNPNCLNYLGQDKWEDEGAYSVDAFPMRSSIFITFFLVSKGQRAVHKSFRAGN